MEKKGQKPLFGIKYDFDYIDNLKGIVKNGPHFCFTFFHFFVVELICKDEQFLRTPYCKVVSVVNTSVHVT